MQIESAPGGGLTLLLSDGELAALGLSFEELDGDSPATRRLLQELLRLAARQKGRSLSGRVTVEALPLEGGCLLLVTPLGPEASPAPTLFRVANGDDLLQLARGIRGTRRLDQSSSLYREGEGYWLVIYGELPREGALWECAQPAGEGAAAAAAAAERGIPLFIGDALPRLAQAVSEAGGQRH
jgi:hypothetical protein